MRTKIDHNPGDERDNTELAYWKDWQNARAKRKVMPKLVLFGALAIPLFGVVVMLLWNWLMPEIFGLRTLTYWQAWGVLALSCILFGRIGGGRGKSSSDRKRKRKLRSYIREQMEEDEEKKAKAAKG